MESRNPEMVVAYAAGRLDREAAQAFEQHMHSCAACRSTAAEQSSLWKALDLWEAPPISPYFDQLLYNRIPAEVPLPWWQTLARAFRSMPLRQAIPLTATAGLLFAAGMMLQHPNKISTTSPAVRTVRVEQVERTLDDLELLGQFNGGNQGEGAPHHAM
jgi:hypothetical protein